MKKIEIYLSREYSFCDVCYDNHVTISMDFYIDDRHIFNVFYTDNPSFEKNNTVGDNYINEFYYKVYNYLIPDKFDNGFNYLDLIQKYCNDNNIKLLLTSNE